MINADNLYKFFLKKKIDFFTGVPDSVLRNFTNKLPNNSKNHLMAVNEGSAVSIGIGYYLSKKKLPCVYFQNSGLGNAINPLISIASKEVYSIPMCLLIGWRGAPGQNDEPQHKAKGKITISLLKLLKIPYCIVENDKDFIKINKLINISQKKNIPIAVLIKKSKILKQKIKNQKKVYKKGINRLNFLKSLINEIDKNARIIATTGYTSRELYYLRKVKNLNNAKDFYMVGGMGHSASVSIAYSSNSKKKVICLDGDGSLLMHLGSLNTINNKINVNNFKHILLNNFSHESVGGQKTNSNKINFSKLTKSIGYKKYFCIKNSKELLPKLKSFLNLKKQSFLEVIINPGSLEELGRPKNFKKIKELFIT